MARGERLKEAIASIGLGPRDALRWFTVGAIGGALFMTTIIGISAAAGWYTIGSIHFDAASFALWTVVFAAVALNEEILMRGVVFTFVSRRLGVPAAVAITSTLFGVFHLFNDNSTPASAIGIALHSGLAFAGLLLLTGSLWAPIGAHFAWNLFEGPVWGAPVSGMGFDAIVDARWRGPEIWAGGAFGPEAGLVTIVGGAGIGVALLYAAWRRDRFRWPPPMRATRSPAPDASA